MMTRKQKKLMSELRGIANGSVVWGFAQVDVDAIRLALAEIERLTQENDDLKSNLNREPTKELKKKNAELAVLCVDLKCEVTRLKLRLNAILDAPMYSWLLLGQDDGEKEVIE